MNKKWNYLFVLALLIIAVGFFFAKIGNSDMLGRILILIGALLFVLDVVGSSREYKKKPCHCPVCKNAVRPMGRWLPGMGYNGTNTIPCPHCGATFHISELEQDE